MNEQVRDLLARGAARPAVDVDVRALRRAARRARRRRVLASGAGAVVVVALLAVATATALGGGSAKVAIAPRSEADVPDGWRLVDVPDAGVRIAVPPDWVRLETVETGGGVLADELLVVGTSDLSRAGRVRACADESAAVPAEGGTWVSLYEYGDEPGSELVLPGGSPASPDLVTERPTAFEAGGGTGASCSVDPANPSAETQSSRTFVFRDEGRLFAARIDAVGTTAEPNLEIGYRVLDTLVVDPPGGTPTPTTLAPPSTTSATSPGTTVPATLPGDDDGDGATDDERAIRAAFLAWMNAEARNDLDGIVEDFAGIADSHRAGTNQHSPENLARYSGRVDSAQIVDADHAEVRYTILHSGRPQYADQPGRAVRIDGRWLVTRETVCDLLRYGNITCPPRS